MDELKFVLKGLVFAILVTMALQISVGGETLEVKSDRLLHHSSVGIFLNQAAEGAATLLRKGTRAASDLIGNSKSESRHQRTQSSADTDDSPEKE